MMKKKFCSALKQLFLFVFCGVESVVNLSYSFALLLTEIQEMKNDRNPDRDEDEATGRLFPNLSLWCHNN